jgi:spermidine/putrescine transport system substrate-binding protein
MSHDIDGLFARSFGRRDFFRYTGLLAGAGVLAACSKASTGGNPSGSPIAHPPIGQESGSLQIFDWAGYEVKPLWTSYAKKFPGQTPSWTTYKDDQSGYSKTAANPDGATWDIVHPCHYFWPDWVALQKGNGDPLLQPWDPSLMPNLKQINPAFVPQGQINGKQYFIPVDWGYAAPLYRSDKVQPKEDSWSLIFDDRYKGKISWWDNFDMFIAAALYNGIAKPYDMTDDELARMKQFLISKKGLVKTYWSIDPVTEAMANGDVWIAYAWPLHYVELKGKGFPAVYMNPKEGRTAWYCGFALANATKNYRHAHEFVNSWISAASGQYLVSSYAYGSLNTAIDLKKIPKDLVKVFSLDNPNALAEPNSHPELNIAPDRRAVYERLWGEVKAA